VDPAGVVADWESAGTAQLAAALDALSQIGVHYRRLGSDPSQGFDCSGLTSYAWSTLGVELPRSSWEQLRVDGHGQGEALLGDLVGYPGHVMLYLGGGAIVHAPYTGRTVEVDALRRHVDHFVSPDAPAGVPVRHAFVMARVRTF